MKRKKEIIRKGGIGENIPKSEALQNIGKVGQTIVFRKASGGYGAYSEDWVCTNPRCCFRTKYSCELKKGRCPWCGYRVV